MYVTGNTVYVPIHELKMDQAKVLVSSHITFHHHRFVRFALN